MYVLSMLSRTHVSPSLSVSDPLYYVITWCSMYLLFNNIVDNKQKYMKVSVQIILIFQNFI